MRKHPFFRTGAYALLSLGAVAGLAMAYSYTWIGGSSGYWNGANWTRTGCESPCSEYPDDTGDDATISTTTQILNPAGTIDDITVTNADVRLGTTSGGYCSRFGFLTVDSVTVTASSGQTAQLRGGNCEELNTN